MDKKMKLFKINGKIYKGIDKWNATEENKEVLKQLKKQEEKYILVEDTSELFEYITFIIDLGYKLEKYITIEEPSDWRDKKHLKKLLVFKNVDY